MVRDRQQFGLTDDGKVRIFTKCHKFGIVREFLSFRFNDGKIQWSRKSFENVTDFCHFCHMTQVGHILSIHEPA